MASKRGIVAKSFSKLTGAARKQAELLRDRIRGSFLPGEDSLTDARLADAAAFLLEAAQHRKEGEASILVRSGQSEGRITQIAVINKDMPFLVDSVALAVATSGQVIDLMVHPILPVRRDQDGALSAILEGDGTGEKRESMIYLETARVDAKTRRALEAELVEAIGDTRAAVADWPRMQELISEDADRLADAEGAALLRWLGGGMMTQLGHLTRARDGKQSAMLGICRKSARDLAADSTYDAAFAWFDGEAGKPGRSPLIVKANRLSNVHRRVPLDVFIVPIMEKGRVAALSVHAGLWTSAALASAPAAVPVLRQQLSTIMGRLNFHPGGHDEKALIHALTALPHDLVISFSDDDITQIATAMMSLADRPRPRVAMVTAPLGRHIFAFVWLPRDMLSTATRTQIQGLMEIETRAIILDWSLVVEGGNLALLRYVLDSRGQAGTPDQDVIDAKLQEMLRGWADSVESALAETEEPGRAAALAARYADCFPLHYRTANGPQEAVHDIERLRLLATCPEDFPLGRAARLYAAEASEAASLRLKIYQHEGTMPLSDAVPALENFGFRVLFEFPTRLHGADGGTIHDFTLGLPAGQSANAVLERASEIEHAITNVINGLSEDDVFNRLVTATALRAHEADWLRAFYRYLRQTGLAFTIYTVVSALAAAPEVTRGLVDLFRKQHDPKFDGNRAQAAAAAEESIRVGLAGVKAINDDRLLRLYWQTIGAVLRTNAFAPAAPALALKIDSALVPGLPKPVPWREIFVYSRRVEGIHLRAGPVARGGLRWSDRRDDYRTEVLGLMKAQRVKNAVIVPTGAKGGFYPKQLPSPELDRDAWFAEGKESYKLFIRSLLSVTDNIVKDRVVHPAGVVIHDGDDPYFVVAADKGTASFSDTANTIAIEHDFWLGDAFASGGSNGYDHKAMGITARGAWLSVQRHFAEMGVDVQSEPVRVAGCGDMSGDVFGNGMLLSKAIKLVAAFDHRHIFIDPDPDPAKSWEERQRLFNLPRSSWDDYNSKLISKGGGIFARTTKRIELSPQIQAILGIDADALDPDSLISVVLKSPVDLMWFGGIGTYIKAQAENHVQVGDPANDLVRVDGKDMRAKVIGEGANLGVTQAGRIEFALGGGRINADFIDNSAGVDCSDNEVNIKIALAAARRSGKLSEARRNEVLQDMTDAVSALVLEDNRLQALALSIAESGGSAAVASQSRLIDILESQGDLDRQTEGLADAETYVRRASEGLGLTRPELAVLLSSSKLVLQSAIENSDLAADESAIELLLGDFPPGMQENFRRQLLEHRLRGEIVATVVANRIVNRMGMVHPFELAEEEGVSMAQIGCAFVAACNLLGLDEIWQQIDHSAMPETARLMLFDKAASALRGHMADLLRAGHGKASPADLVADIGGILTELAGYADALPAGNGRDQTDAMTQAFIAAGAPEKLARMVTRLFAMDGAIGLAILSRASGIGAVDLAGIFVNLGARVKIDWAQAKAADMNPSDPWERLLVAELARDFQQMRLDFLKDLSNSKTGKADISAALESWLDANESAIARFRELVNRAQKSAPVSPAMLAQIASQARNLLQ